MRAERRAKVRHRGKRWYLSITDSTGQEDAHGGFATKREAEARAREILTDASRGRYVSPGKLTVGTYLSDEWLGSRENADVSVNTRDVERTMVEAWVIPHIGDVPLQLLTAKDLDRLYSRLRSSGGRGGRPLRGKSVRNVHVLLSKAFGDAVRRGHLVTNPVHAVDPPAKDDSVERLHWTAAEVRRFLKACSADRLAGIWRLALATGMRRGELLGVQWTDVSGDSVTVARQVLLRPRSGHPRVYVRPTTKTRRVRKVRIDPVSQAALKEWKASQSRERLAFGPAWRADGSLGVEALWMVTEPDGSVIHPDTLLARWKRLVKAADVREIPLHGARHSYAMVALEAGARLDVVSRQLGHASIGTTANVYGHDDDEAAAAAARLLSSALDEKG